MRAGPLSGGANALGLLSYRGNLAALRHNRMTLGFECSVQAGNGVAAWRVSEAGKRAGSPDRPLLRRHGGRTEAMDRRFYASPLSLNILANLAIMDK